jgi:hypothetical protein
MTPRRKHLKTVHGRGRDQGAGRPGALSVRWITGAGEVELKSWAELTEKLKTPFIKEGTAAFHKVHALNAGGDGWELMEQTVGTRVSPAGGFGGGPKDRGPGARSGLISTATGT